MANLDHRDKALQEHPSPVMQRRVVRHSERGASDQELARHSGRDRFLDVPDDDAPAHAGVDCHNQVKIVKNLVAMEAGDLHVRAHLGERGAQELSSIHAKQDAIFRHIGQVACVIQVEHRICGEVDLGHAGQSIIENVLFLWGAILLSFVEGSLRDAGEVVEQNRATGGSVMRQAPWRSLPWGQGASGSASGATPPESGRPS